MNNAESNMLHRSAAEPLDVHARPQAQAAKEWRVFSLNAPARIVRFAVPVTLAVVWAQFHRAGVIDAEPLS